MLTARLLRTAVQRTMTSGVQYSKPPARLRRLQEKFQLHNDLPVHLKGGYVDTLLFSGTAILCTYALALVGMFIYEKSFPKKEE